MTPGKSSVLAGLGAVAFLAGLYEYGVTRRQAGEIAALKAQAAGQQQKIQSLVSQQERVRARAAGPAKTPDASAVGAPPGSTPLELMMGSVLERAERLKARLRQSPGQEIPEMRYLEEKDWMEVAENAEHLDSEEDFRRALANLRLAAEQQVVPRLQQALTEYLKAAGGQFPTDVTQLMPYLKPPLDPAILQRYAVKAGDQAAGPSAGIPYLTIRDSAVVDSTMDSSLQITADGYSEGNGASNPTAPNISEETSYSFQMVDGKEAAVTSATAMEALNAYTQARQAFEAANKGASPTSPEQLLPYFKDPAQVVKFMELAHGQK